MSAITKRLTMLISALLAIALLASCAGPASPGATASTAPSSGMASPGESSQQPAAPGEPDGVPAFPLAEPLTVSVYTELSSKYAGIVDNLAELFVYELIKEQCNVEFKFEHASSSIAAEQYGLMFASGNYPDVIAMYRSLYYPGGLAAAYSDGIIIPLNRFMDGGYTPNYKAILDAYPPAYEELLNDGGNILEFCQFNNFELRASEGPIIRQDLLNEYGLSTPVTLGDWDNVLRTFKENGIAIPLAFQNGIQTMRSSSAFVGSFGIGFQLYQEEGAIKYGSIQPQFKEYLQLMRNWYADGLIDPDFVAAEQVVVRSQMVEGLVGAAIGARGGLMSNAWTAVVEQNPDSEFELMPLNYPVTSTGEGSAVIPKVYYTNNGWSITKSAEKPELVSLAIDWFYGHDGWLARRHGREGEHYFIESGKIRNWKDAGDGNYPSISVKDTMDASPAPYSSLYFDAAQNKLLQSDEIMVPTPKSNDKLTQMKALISDMSTYANRTWTNEPAPGNLPALVLTTEESTAYANIMTTVETYIDEMVVQFILGLESLDNFDKFVEQQKKMEIEKALAYYQAAMDRYISSR